MYPIMSIEQENFKEFAQLIYIQTLRWQIVHFG
jgi:hypothetical protein